MANDKYPDRDDSLREVTEEQLLDMCYQQIDQWKGRLTKSLTPTWMWLMKELTVRLVDKSTPNDEPNVIRVDAGQVFAMPEVALKSPFTDHRAVINELSELRLLRREYGRMAQVMDPKVYQAIMNELGNRIDSLKHKLVAMAISDVRKLEGQGEPIV